MFRPWKIALPFGLLLLSVGQAWAYTGDTVQEDIKREFSGQTSYTIPLSAPSEPSPASTPCSTTLDQEMAAGEIPANENCSCPTGATQPVCTSNASNVCQELLVYDRADPSYQYDECSCAPEAGTPTCVSFHQLCEENLPNYQTTSNQCSCPTNMTDAVPECQSDYSICEENLPSYQNSTNECSCSEGMTTTTPSCESDYDICENNARQYENGSTTCSCNQNSTEPTCCTTVTTQQCSQQCTGQSEWSCSITCNEVGSGFDSLYCWAGGIAKQTGDPVVPSNYCSSIGAYADPTCNCGNGGGYATQTSDQSCHTVCTPASTQSCRTE